MYCPNCGSKNSVEQKFCRSCGLGLEGAAQSLVEQLPSQAPENLEKRRDQLERWGVVALIGFGAIGFGAIFYNIIFKMILAQGKILSGIALMLLFICGLLAVFFFTYANSLKATAAKRRMEDSSVLPEKRTAELLPEPDFEPVQGSVTERTTELLYAEKKGKTK